MSPRTHPRSPLAGPTVRALARALARVLARVVTIALAAAVLAVLPTATPPAQASSVYLCTGYSGCASAGYSSAGYASRSDRMYWRMYAGHNCTNYAAYRMIQAGMPAERPWSGSGNASNWGHAMSSITDDTPAVGAIAWWDRNVVGAGSSGHVAYVEQVVSATEIVISEDSWSGDFHWRRIIKDGPGWPSGFVHFVDKTKKAVEVVTAPKIGGTPQVGTPLRAIRARFKPAADHAFQWFSGATPIAGATGAVFTPSAAQVGRPISVRDKGTRSGFLEAPAFSTPTRAVANGVFARVRAPGVTGVPQAGQTLTAVPGAFSPAPESVTYRWKVGGVWLQNRNGPTFTLGQDDVGKSVQVVQVSNRAGYQRVFGASAKVGPVMAGAVQEATPFTSSGSTRPGSTLSFAGGTWTPAGGRLAYQWLRDGQALPDATTGEYRVTQADIGHTIGVQVVVSKARYTQLVRRHDFGVVTTASTMSVYAGGRKRGAQVRVQVRAPGAGTPTGLVTATVGDHQVSRRLENGKATLDLVDLGVGRRVVRIVYAGNGVARPSGRIRTVVVKP